MAGRRLVLNGLTAEVAGGAGERGAGGAGGTGTGATPERGPSPEFYHELELYRQLLALAPPERRARTPDPPHSRSTHDEGARRCRTPAPRSASAGPHSPAPPPAPHPAAAPVPLVTSPCSRAASSPAPLCPLQLVAKPARWRAAALAYLAVGAKGRLYAAAVHFSARPTDLSPHYKCHLISTLSKDMTDF
ncbi:unnamed protein product [Colias eurytheme]|nr:unnamed protein product [Colias eurytheme]